MAGSATEITMPQMGAEMEEGTLLRWLKHPGEHVARGEVIAEIETDKANIEIESFEEGVLQRTLVEEGQVVPVGDVIALINTSGDAAASVEPADGAPLQQSGSTGTTIPPVSEAAIPPGGPGEGAAISDAGSASTRPEHGHRKRVSPVARSIAEQLGVDLNTISGTGPDGRIVRKDVERAASRRVAADRTPTGPAEATPPAAPSPAPATAAGAATAGSVSESRRTPEAIGQTDHAAAGTTVPAEQTTVPRVPPDVRPDGQAGRAASTSPPAPEQPAPEAGVVVFSRMRAAIARSMSQSKRDVPHYYVTAEVDMTEAMQFRTRLNEAAGDTTHVSVNDLIIKACAIVLGRLPRFNAAFAGTGVRMNEQINICIAVAVPDGLIAPALLDAGNRSLGAIARAAADLASRARDGGLKGAELTGGTFTISNVGMYGIETLIPIIQLPQSAILGVGAVQEKPAVRDGQIVIRRLMMVALAADHRVTNGAEGGEFLREFKKVLEEPVGLAL
jgi:pyruvate dehydrogenase E2 component (dihydrolipoamide acetyltransferase)